MIRFKESTGAHCIHKLSISLMKIHKNFYNFLVTKDIYTVLVFAARTTGKSGRIVPKTLCMQKIWICALA